MPDPSHLDQSRHIGPAFRDTFATWPDLIGFLHTHADTPEFDVDRALHQLVMTDIAARLVQAEPFGWGPARLVSAPRSTGATHRKPPGVAPVYATARPAFDVDLCATVIPAATDPDGTVDLRVATRELRHAAEHVIDVTADARPGHGVGLGGLVHYSSADLRELRPGRVVAQVTAQPIDPRSSSSAHYVPVDDPITVHVDVSPPGAAAFPGPPEPAQRSLLAITIPGFAPFRPDLYPTTSQVADKLTALVVPHINPPWHRFKDLFDLHYLISLCDLDTGRVRAAIGTNPNLVRNDLIDLPQPYRLHGHLPGAGEPAVAWRSKYEQLRAGHPALAGYPPFGDVLAEIVEFRDGLAHATGGSSWDPRRRAWAVADHDAAAVAKLAPTRPPWQRAAAATVAPLVNGDHVPTGPDYQGGAAPRRHR
ncbi:MAG: hypothetical protein QOE61_1841 [Micromonosporaceae bacterium]|jgi:hypothetical protein|nr:hypothetical protein [Micromonosporaceae bacterium]